MQFSINGIGTTIYGMRNFRNDGSHVTTEWFVFFFLPIWPLQSMRISSSDDNSFFFPYTYKYVVVEYLSSIDKVQVFCTYFYTYLYVVIIKLYIDTSFTSLKYFFIFSVFYALVPFLLRLIEKPNIERNKEFLLESTEIKKDDEPNVLESEVSKKCPYCAEEIKFEAIKCKHCGEWLEERPK